MKDVPRVLIDTDMSIDDWMTILYLLNRSDVEVIGLSITGTGVAHGQAGARNAMRLLQLAGHAEKHIPVGYGDDEPSDGYHTFPEPWRDAIDTMYGVSLPASTDQPVKQHAVNLIISLLENSDMPVTILAIGPLTNLAALLEHAPAVQDKIQRIYIMGGALRVKGQIIVPGITDHLRNEVADWNSYIDPLATQRVLRSEVPITLVPLDATNKVPLTQGFAQVFKEKAVSPEAKFLDKVFDHQIPTMKTGSIYFWDPLTASAIVDQDLCHFERLPIDVIVEYSESPPSYDLPSFSKMCKNGQPRRHFDQYVSGQIVISEDGKIMDVCTDVDAEAFYKRFMQVINGEWRS